MRFQGQDGQGCSAAGNLRRGSGVRKGADRVESKAATIALVVAARGGFSVNDPDRLPDDAFVVRGGVVSGAKLRGASELYHGVFGFSVQSYPNQTVRELAEAMPIPHGMLGVTTVGQIRAAGYEVLNTPGNGLHATVIVPRTWSEQEADTLAARFVMQRNPVKGH